MDEKQENLIKAVKTAVAKYGLSNVSTRNIGDIAQVNDAYIYKFFKDKEDLLLQAYVYENGKLFQSLLYELDKAHALPLPFREKAHTSFVKVWRMILSDPDRLSFCVFYYHSAHFKNAEGYHNEQLTELQNRLCGYFPNMEVCTQTLYAMFTMLYDSAYSVVSGKEKDTGDYAERVFEMEMAVMGSQIKSQSFLGGMYYYAK